MKGLSGLALSGFLLAALLTSPSLAMADARAEAISLYDQGRFAEAGRLLEQIDAAGEADGPLLYRLAFCQRRAGSPRAPETQERARVALEEALSTTRDLSVHFYLANTYQNTGRKDDALRIAAEATVGFEQGDLDPPATGNQHFQLAKLYADQDLLDRAAEWFTKALAALAEEGDRGGPYVRWASRFLAERAFESSDFATAAEHYTTLTQAGGGDHRDLDRLAVSQVHAGNYMKAAGAWRKAEQANPADADRARYCNRLARAAARLGTLPEQDPSGKPWGELAQQDLQKLMGELAGQAKQAGAEAADPDALSEEEKAKLRARFAELQPPFVAAALEYALRGHSIREAAFFGGYAPLIFRSKLWRIPGERDPNRKKKKKRKKKKAVAPE